jgi:hypothetical protein
MPVSQAGLTINDIACRDGKFGLWIDSNFDKGFTTSCPAFANDPLCAPSLIKTGVDGLAEGKFEIMAVECWAVG